MSSIPQSLAIQTVVFCNEFVALERALKAVFHSASRAQSKKLISRWIVRWGDCSPSQIVPEEETGKLKQLASQHGGEFEYVFLKKISDPPLAITNLLPLQTRNCSSFSTQMLKFHRIALNN